MKYFFPPFDVANIEQQNKDLRKAFEVSPGLYAPGINEVEQEYEICLRLCKVMEGKKIRKTKPLFPNFEKKKTNTRPPIINRTTIIIDPDKIINLVEFIAGLTKKK